MSGPREYTELKQQLLRGWNTWNTRSVLSHVWLPAGFALNLGLKEYRDGAYLKEALIGRQGADEERIHPGPRAWDDRYTELNLQWRGLEVVVQSATEDDDLVLLVTPRARQRHPALIVLEAGLLWNRAGHVQHDGDALVGRLPGADIRAFATGAPVVEPYIAAQTPYLARTLAEPVGFSTGRRRSLAEIEEVIARRRSERLAATAGYGDLAETYTAMQTCLAWDTVYDPLRDRAISTVSRLWNIGSGGYVLFEWDNYFAAFMAAVDNKAVAYSNAIEITREATEEGFVPNFARPHFFKSRDRSQPPVGATVVSALYRRFGDRWLIEELFAPLLRWNRWWPARRRAGPGLLAWGSDPYEPVVDNYWELTGVNERFGGALESGLDNSPMYDDVPFNKQTHRLELADVGLTSLYIADCGALAEIATALGRSAEAAELTARAAEYRAGLQTLWSETAGMFLNRRTDTGAFCPRLSPTNFYPLLARAATPAQAQRMIAGHFDNPREFGGDWVLPSIARNDPAYPDQDYWRGRIWPPMNLLVYLGLRHYDLPDARRALVEKSQALLLKEWRAHGHVHENYNADTGEGCDKGNSDRFYHWGGLLGLIAFLEANQL